MKLYVVEFEMAWDGGEVAGVYTTRKAAEARANSWSAAKEVPEIYYTRITEIENDKDIVTGIEK